MAISSVSTQSIIIGLDAVIVAVTSDQPSVLTVRRTDHVLTPDGSRTELSLPFGPFQPEHHRTLEIGMRSWVGEQTGLPLGYVEQLYTFGDRFRDSRELTGGPRVVTVGYLALTRQDVPSGSGEARWLSWYEFLPWEDWREGRPPLVDRIILPQLNAWATEQRGRAERVMLAFGDANAGWDPYRVLERYELLYEAGLVFEAHRDFEKRRTAHCEDETVSRNAVDMARLEPVAMSLGQSMAHDHRRILATAISRMRGKLKYRPVVFELLPDTFTLLQLQRVVESLSGVTLHKQNFRRLVTNNGLVEDTGRQVSQSRGRPAALFRFRREVIRERTAPGMTLPSSLH